MTILREQFNVPAVERDIDKYGKVNPEHYLLPDGNEAAPETLLMIGLVGEPVLPSAEVSGHVIQWSMQLMYEPRGWNNAPDECGNWRMVGAVGTGKPMYETWEQS